MSLMIVQQSAIHVEPERDASGSAGAGEPTQGSGGEATEQVREVASICEGGAAALCGANTAARRVRVTLIREGLAATGRYYTAGALDDIYRQADGLKAFADHPSKVDDYSRPARSVRDIVGFYTDPERVPSPGGAVRATLHVLEAAGWLWSLIQEALRAGRTWWGSPSTRSPACGRRRSPAPRAGPGRWRWSKRSQC